MITTQLTRIQLPENNGRTAPSRPLRRARTSIVPFLSLVLAVLSFWCDAPARATTPGPPPEGWVVGSLDDPPFPTIPGTLRNVIDIVNQGPGPSTIHIFVEGTLELNQPLPPIETDVKIVGPGADLFTLGRRSGAPNFRLLTIGAGRNVEISGVTLSNGRTDDLADDDGAAILSNGNLTLNRCVLSNNVARNGNGNGGAIFSNGNLTLDECVVSNNLGREGGGIGTGIVDGARLIVRNSAFLNNVARHLGGAINHSHGTNFGEENLLLNCTFSGNYGDCGGGAISNLAYGGMTTLLNLFNCTISENETAEFGGGILCEANSGFSRIIINNCIVAGNTAGVDGTDIEVDESAELFRDRVNLIGANDGVESAFPVGQPNANGDYVGSLLAPLDPRLRPLGNHGGSTPTYEPEPFSFAVDPPTNITPLDYSRDQRGKPRFQDADCDALMIADIGAHELDDYQAGNVNAGTGPAVDVLRVNECTEEINRVVEVGAGEPITISLDASPSGPMAARYFLCIWIGAPANPTALTTSGGSFGKFVNPTPLQGGLNPQPFKCLASSDLPAIVCGVARENFSPFRAPWIVSQASGLNNPGFQLTLQGLLEDSGSNNPQPFSITNAVGIKVTP